MKRSEAIKQVSKILVSEGIFSDDNPQWLKIAARAVLRGVLKMGMMPPRRIIESKDDEFYAGPVAENSWEPENENKELDPRLR